MDKTPLVSLLVINWNGERHLPQLLESLQNQTYENIEVIVFDSDSSDKSLEVCKKFQKVKTISSKNFGYSGGANRAIGCAKGEYFFVLNNDLVLEKNCVKECIKAFGENESAGIVFPKQLYFADFPNNKAVEFIPMAAYAGNTVQKPAKTETNFVLGAAFLISKNCLNGIKYCFDERFFMYFEDTDLSFRAIAKGYKIVYAEKAVFWHKTAASVPESRLYYLFRNCLLCYYKNFGLPDFVKFFPLIFLKDFLTVSIDLKFKKGCLNQMAKAYLDAFFSLKKFGGEKFSKAESKRVLNSLIAPNGGASNGSLGIFKKFYAKFSQAYFKAVILK